MNIKPEIFNIYKSNNLSAGHIDKNVAAKAEISRDGAKVEAVGKEKLDTVTISNEGSGKRDIAKITSMIMADINRLDSSARADEIKDQIHRDNYYVSPEEVANTILAHMFVE